jgi:malate dehydrogenase (oxaloacetate-decarboxylating)
MKIAAAQAIADFIGAEELTADNIIPSPLDKRVALAVAQATASAARQSGVARID